ncbi:MAG: radical SAM protein, partial [Synergistaceae bacterium]|nr:radical SAM protein [Synergistaceae bacterium]
MINISRVLFPDKCSFPGDSLRYAPRREFRFPVVVWHLTGRCNLSCRHCYAEAAGGSGEFPLESGREFLRLLSANSVPALLFSGGEPMCCENFFRYLEEANLLGMKVTVSTNGSL